MAAHSDIADKSVMSQSDRKHELPNDKFVSIKCSRRSGPSRADVQSWCCNYRSFSLLIDETFGLYMSEILIKVTSSPAQNPATPYCQRTHHV